MSNKVQFIRNQPALKIGKTLIIADLHLGKSHELWEKGFSLPRQAEILAKRLNKLKKKTKTSTLVILGDIKNRIGFANYEEIRELPRFFSALEFEKIIAVKGNHDGGIERALPERVKLTEGFTIGDYALTHGHRNIQTKKKTIIIGHNQPHVKFIDKVRAVYTEPVWVLGKLRGKYKGKELIIMPAFNELCGATIINQDELLGPLARRLIKKTARLHLLDGTDIGTIGDLQLEPRSMTPKGVGTSKKKK
ncbi:MAG: metallophosphoesterase [Candidatus Aenigmarchaeota archaeon]|nr:metallophosphoesterase [Candidatus Aenigmarchaeota archaeon]